MMPLVLPIMSSYASRNVAFYVQCALERVQIEDLGLRDVAQDFRLPCPLCGDRQSNCDGSERWIGSPCILLRLNIAELVVMVSEIYYCSEDEAYAPIAAEGV